MSEPLAADNNFDVPAFFSGGSEIEKLIREYNWSATAFGAVESWSPGLCTAVRICLNAAAPVIVYWGNEFNILYNNAFSIISGNDKLQLGRPAKQIWPDAWDGLEPQLQKVINGRPASYKISYPGHNHQSLTSELSFTPIYDKDGTIQGVFGLAADVPKTASITEQILEESEQRFRELVTATSDVVYRMNPDWSVMRELKGRGFLSDSGQPISNWLQEYIDASEHARVTNAFNEAIATKGIFQLEHKVMRADGTPGWTFSVAVPILDNEGEIIEWFGSARDITQRKLTEDALREAKEFSEQQRRLYETITSGTPDLIYVFDLDYRFTYANQALLAMWGKTWETAIGKGLLENGYEPWHAEMHEREIDTVRATRQPIRGEVSFPHATQGRRIYDYILTPVINEDGQVEAVAGTTRDITDIKNAETAIIESEARFRTMAEGTNIYIAMADETSGAIYFNQAWTNLTGLSEADLIAFAWLDRLHPDDKDRYLKIYLDAFTVRVPFHADFRVLNKEGQYRWLLADGSPRWYTDGSFAGYISASIDITELKEDERRKNDFISMVSHELKTPLTSTIGYVQVSQQKSLANGDTLTSGMLHRADKQLGKMTRMINGFLNLSRLESGKIDIDRQQFDMALLIKEAQDESLASIPSHQLIFEPIATTWVNADREKTGQVINNLISNAVKYSAPGSTINVNCIAANGKVQVSITDEGIGVSEEDLPKLFQRYYRVKDGVNKHIAGFGIGLYLSSELVKGHGGEIWAESTPGKGSTFYFTLPLEP